MDKRFFAFIVLASLALAANMMIMNWLAPPPPARPKPQQQVADKPGEAPGEAAIKEPAEAAPGVAAPSAVQPVEKSAEAAVAPAPPAEAKEHPARWLTLGSVDSDSANPYRMLVTLSSQGAAVERIELAGNRLNDLENDSGYLGHLAALDAEDDGGATVRVVGAGTPAARAGLKVDDTIVALDGKTIKNADDLSDTLKKSKSGHTIELSVRRGDEKITGLKATLTRHPLEVVGPEGADPASLLLTLEQLGTKQISKELGLKTREPESGKGAVVSEVLADSPAADGFLRVGDVIVKVDEQPIAAPSELDEMIGNLPAGMRITLSVQREGQEIKLPLRMPVEIAGLTMRSSHWEVKAADEQSVAFAWQVPGAGLEIIKHYRLAKAEAAAADRAYHLTVEVQIANRGDEPQTVAYQFDGPTGLPTEGWWYANKIGRDGIVFPGPIGVRDVAVQFEGQDVSMISAQALANKDAQWNFPKQSPLKFIGIDAQYFSAVLIPQYKSENDDWFAKAQPLRVGPVSDDPARRKLVNTSCRVVSKAVMLAPGEPPLSHEFVFFAGPKRTGILEHYAEVLQQPGLRDLVYYGWTIWAVFARLMSGLLHFFYDIVGNYGLAIIMLTVLVRACMFPLSRKQAISAQKMQELQPEIKKIAEKYKNNLEARNKAQQELFKKHNYNPLGGCLLMFVQLPIFLGLYRGLMIDVELRQAALVPGWRWCSNLAAPDMLFRWDSWMPQFFASETGWLGPYFNILPIVTIGLFLWQQKMFMPPPTDEQTAMQQKLMKYMMVVMGLLFFKVASGLCIYFIASSLWGIAERKLLPKVTPPAPKKTSQPDDAPPARVAAGANGHGGGTPRKKQRGGK